jgi:hypothetical protein
MVVTFGTLTSTGLHTSREGMHGRSPRAAGADRLPALAAWTNPAGSSPGCRAPVRRGPPDAHVRHEPLAQLGQLALRDLRGQPDPLDPQDPWAAGQN